jgi:hypothetical protein
LCHPWRRQRREYCGLAVGPPLIVLALAIVTSLHVAAPVTSTAPAQTVSVSPANSAIAIDCGWARD